jgi:DNA helicase-2/ATP-dependent DNA helicase PcrA
MINLKQEEKKQLSIFDFKPVAENTNASKDLKIKNNLNQFSFTQLASFKICPLQYKYQYI